VKSSGFLALALVLLGAILVIGGTTSPALWATFRAIYQPVAAEVGMVPTAGNVLARSLPLTLSERSFLPLVSQGLASAHLGYGANIA
jgi:hypothetical protein